MVGENTKREGKETNIPLWREGQLLQDSEICSMVDVDNSRICVSRRSDDRITKFRRFFFIVRRENFPVRLF